LAGKEPVLGIPPDPQHELEELVKEVKAEVEARQRKGLGRAKTMPEVQKKAM